MNEWSMQVLSTGKTAYGQWVLCNLSNGVVLFNGICQLDKEYDLKKDKIYPVRTIDFKQNKQNKIIVKLGL